MVPHMRGHLTITYRRDVATFIAAAAATVSGLVAAAALVYALVGVPWTP